MTMRLRRTVMQVEDVWADLAINPERPIFRRVDEEHPLDLYLGLDQAEDRVLMLVNEAEPPEVPSFEAIAISKSARGDGRWFWPFGLCGGN